MIHYIVALFVGIFALTYTVDIESKIYASNAAFAQSNKVGPVTGLPLPRYVSLRSAKVNARTGPALRYPIQWVYKRAGLPVEITAEYDAWRQIRDIDGSISWVHSTLLSGKRTAYIHHIASELDLIPAFKKPKEGARRVLDIEQSALGDIKRCENSYCLVDFKAYRGWVEKKYIWGIYQNEIID